MNILSHKKFWAPVLILVIILAGLEAFFRSGLYHQALNPDSFLGNTHIRLSAIESYGTQKVEWITVGDSKIDWGLDHGKIKNAQHLNGINHIRFSFAGSNFFTYQTSIEWAIAHYKNLDTVLIGVSETELFSSNQASSEVKIAWPFRRYIDFNQFTYFGIDNNIITAFKRLALYNFLPDFKQLLKNPLKRRDLVKSVKMSKQLNYHVSNNKNLCEYDLSSLQSCQMAASNAEDQKVSKQYREFFNICNSPKAQKQLANNSNLNPGKSIKKYSDNWTRLFQTIIEQKKNVVFVLFPEHYIYDYYKRPINSQVLINEIKTHFKGVPQFQFLDLRDAFTEQNKCQYFSDMNHYNNKGNDLITNLLLSKLKP